MLNPYASIHAAAARAAMQSPRLARDTITDARVIPSAASMRQRDARVSAAVFATIAFRSLCQSRGDYYTPVNYPHGPGTFTTKR